MRSEKRTQPPSERQLFVQFEEQRQEVPVGVNRSFLDDSSQSFSQSETLMEHQIRKNQSGRSTHAHDAMHQNFTCDGKKRENCYQSNNDISQ